MNGINTKVDVNIIPLGSYYFLIRMDWLEKYHAILDCYNKTITSLDEEGKQYKVQGSPRAVALREILDMQLKKNFKKRCQVFAAHMEDATKDIVQSIEDHLALKVFVDVFGEILGFPPKKDIEFSIDLVPRVVLVSKTPYIMGTPKLKELQMQLEDAGYVLYSLHVCVCGCIR
jgi:hypothetical protein